MDRSKELKLIDRYFEKAQHNLLSYSKDYAMTEPKEGYEKEWKETKEEIETLVTIGKIVCERDNAPAGQTLEQMQYLIKSALSYSVSMHIEKKDDYRLEVICFDSIERKTLAKFEFNKIGKSLTLMEYELF